MLKGSSPFSDYVDTTFLLIVGLSALVFIGILITMVYFLIRYSRRRNPNPTNIEGSVPLEITWTVIPLILFLGIFYMGWRGYLKELIVPEGALPIKVTARMWAWSFEYPNGVVTDTLYVPVNTPMKLTLHSMDVNHSLFIPAFRIKKDVIPNRENVMWFKAMQVMSYDIACAEFCGLQHSYMYTKVVAKDSVQFEEWYRSVSARQAKPYVPLLSAGPKEQETQE